MNYANYVKYVNYVNYVKYVSCVNYVNYLELREKAGVAGISTLPLILLFILALWTLGFSRVPDMTYGLITAVLSDTDVAHDPVSTAAFSVPKPEARSPSVPPSHSRSGYVGCTVGVCGTAPSALMA